MAYLISDTVGTRRATFSKRRGKNSLSHPYGCQLPQGGSQTDDNFKFGQTLASLPEGRFPHSVGEMSQSDKGGRPCHGGKASALTEGATPNSSLLTPN